MSRMDEIAADVSELKVMVGKIITALEYRATADTARDGSITDLQKQMRTALIPILFAKWAVAVGGGLSVLVGLVYGFIQVAHAFSGAVVP